MISLTNVKDFSQNHLLPLILCLSPYPVCILPAKCMYSDQLRSFEVTVLWASKLQSHLKLLAIVLPISAVPSPLLDPCRSLPYEMLMAELGRTTGQQVCQGNMRYSLTQAFGPDASLKAQAYLGVSCPHLHLHCMLLMMPQSVKSMADAALRKCMHCIKAQHAPCVYAANTLFCILPDLPDHGVRLIIFLSCLWQMSVHGLCALGKTS